MLKHRKLYMSHPASLIRITHLDQEELDELKNKTKSSTELGSELSVLLNQRSQQNLDRY